jgi:predicted nucleic acid-binding protein
VASLALATMLAVLALAREVRLRRALARLLQLVLLRWRWNATNHSADAFLAQQLRLATWINDVPEHYILARDPDDSIYLNLAITAGAPYVVTTDLDLIDLMDPKSTAGVDFRNRFPAVQVITPADFEAQIRMTAP